MKDLYSKYIRNIKNGKTAIKKEYVDRGYFSYYSEKDLKVISKSERIIVDGFNGYFKDFIYDTINIIKEKKILKNKIIYLGKVGPRLAKIIHERNSNETDILNYHILIADDEIQHEYNNHMSSEERKRGQKIIESKDIELLPSLIANTSKIDYIGRNKRGLNIYKFVSYNKDGTYNLIEFVGNGKKQLGLNTLYVNLKKNKKRLMP